jgi:chromosome partitioning protein
MAFVIACAGQKGGVGKSAVCQSIAAEAARTGSSVVLADLDVAQRTSFEWSEARARNGFTPRIKVVVVDADRYGDFGVRQASSGADLLVIDAPGWSDEKTLLLAGFSDVMVLPTGASVADLRPTIRLMHELVAAGVAKERIITALCRVNGAAEIKFARGYLAEAGFSCLDGVLRDMPTYRVLQNQGRAATEADGNLGAEARAMVGEIMRTLKREQERRAAKPERFAPSPERFREAGQARRR